MPYTIAVAGKGGTGKTTLCGMMIDWMIKNGRTPILAVDADANSNLNEVLGVEAPISLGEIREEVAKAEQTGSIPSGVSKQDYMEFRFNAALEEEDDFDMLVMGRTQGKGCYCFVNGLLQTQLQKFSGSYKYVVVDNEAGMEHISRGILPKIDTLLLVSDCSRRGIQAVGRIARLAESLKLNPSRVGLIVNRAPDGELNEGTKEEIALQKLDLIGVMPQDSTVYEFDTAGRPLVELPEDAPVRKAFLKIVDQLNL